MGNTKSITLPLVLKSLEKAGLGCFIMESITTDEIKLIKEGGGYTAVYYEQEKIGVFKKVDTVFIAIKICGFGKNFRSFISHGQAVNWMLKKGSV